MKNSVEELLKIFFMFVMLENFYLTQLTMFYLFAEGVRVVILTFRMTDNQKK